MSAFQERILRHLISSMSSCIQDANSSMNLNPISLREGARGSEKYHKTTHPSYTSSGSAKMTGSTENREQSATINSFQCSALKPRSNSITLWQKDCSELPETHRYRHSCESNALVQAVSQFKPCLNSSRFSSLHIRNLKQQIVSTVLVSPHLNPADLLLSKPCLMLSKHTSRSCSMLAPQKS